MGTKAVLQYRHSEQKPVCFKEYDEEGRVTRWVEMGLALEDRLQHHRHCVVAGTSKVAVHNIEGQHLVEAPELSLPFIDYTFKHFDTFNNDR
ncbi:hypothetical protein NA56DRAFT_699296 [Hyaloscypha hepaticicola]|uniref:Uncharacterized protein n=1 Tax=Hyaloscypha hepaticicola TaxID=2082293 RepID=A0A2J6QGK8_9HELO|nr:hypothetical protein NA56DRAFT_699296 [Hyaloscypha hepaticicola]